MTFQAKLSAFQAAINTRKDQTQPTKRGRPSATTDTAATKAASARCAALSTHDNFILGTDGYKASHYRQYPPKTQQVYSYLESRKGAHFDETVFFGLQYQLKAYYTGARVDAATIDEAERTVHDYFGNADSFHRAGWEHIVQHHGGKLPLSIRAVPEGLPVPVGNVLMTVENTDPACYWLANYVETLLMHVWYGSTVATQSREMKKIIARYLDLSADDTSSLPLKLHDFGGRGVSSKETGKVGAAAHLVNFRGTDTLYALPTIRDAYHEPNAGISVPAAEHSTITSWGKKNELQAYANMLDQYPTGPVSIVADSYDFDNACTNLFGGQLRERILARDGVVIVRPDSGVPKDIVLHAHELLGAAFPTSMNSKGYKVLHPKIAVLQGDGIDLASIEPILKNLTDHGWSTQSLALGSGGGLLQKVNRDTQRLAIKASWGRIDGEGVDIFKNPATDASKRSKAGRFKLVQGEHGLETVAEAAPGEDLLREVFRNGKLLVDDTFAQIRARAALPETSVTSASEA